MPRKKQAFKKTIEEMAPEEVQEQQRKVKRRKMPQIETLDYLYGKACEVSYEYPELTAICPMTGLQDLYTLKITYVPDRKVPELKSLRLHLLAYRDVPILHEHLVNKIFEDFSAAVEPASLKVFLDVAVRGGIHTTVVREST